MKLRKEDGDVRGFTVDYIWMHQTYPPPVNYKLQLRINNQIKFKTFLICFSHYGDVAHRRIGHPAKS